MCSSPGVAQIKFAREGNRAQGIRFLQILVPEGDKVVFLFTTVFYLDFVYEYTE